MQVLGWKKKEKQDIILFVYHQDILFIPQYDK